MHTALLVLLVGATAVVAQEGQNQAGAEGCAVPLDIALVVDASGSIQEQDQNGWESVKNFIIEVTKNFEIAPDKTRFGLTVYSEFAIRQMDDPRIGDDGVGFFDLNQFKDEASLQDAINRLYYFNSLTNTQDGLNVAHSVIFTPAAGDRPRIPNLAIVITDGVSNVQPEEVENQAQQLKDKATVVAVGVSGAKDEELRQIASNENLVLRVTDFRSLAQELERIVSSACGAVVPRDDVAGRCCDFDGEYSGTYCDFAQAGISHFSLRKGETPSEGTGPKEADSGAYYAYLEASNLDEGDNAELWWTNVGLNGSCLSFAYDMHGGHVGELHVEIRESANDEWVDIYNVTEATSDGWQQAVIDINVLVSDLRFRAVRGAGYQGDIALDTIRLTEGACFEPEMEEMNSTDNDTCPEPPPMPKMMPPQPPIIYYPFFQNPGMMQGMPPAMAPPKEEEDDEEEEEEEEVDLSKCNIKEPFQVLLVGGENATYGRVEVYHNRTFGTICNSTFTELEAQAVCRSAGFYGGKIMTDLEGVQTLSPTDEKAVLLDNVRCHKGDELGDCCRGGWGKVSCDHSKDAYVMCDEKPAYCNRPEGAPPMGPEIDLSICDSRAPAFSVILRGGAKPNEGRVEIYSDGQFGTVCNDTFGVKEAMAVCKSLGFYAGNVWKNPPEDLRLAQGVDRPVLLSGVHCEDDSSLGDCCYNAIGFDDGCTHEQDVFVRCYDRPEYCSKKKSGCAAPPNRVKPEPEEEDDDEKEKEKENQQQMPPMPQIFPIPLNPYFAMPFGHQFPPQGMQGMGMQGMPNNMNGGNGGD